MHHRSDPNARRKFESDASLVLVGIRGCGKRSMGFVAAAALKRRFITEDHFFKETTGITRHEYLQKFGTQEFQRRDIEILKAMLDNHRTRCVIEIGLGSLTRPVQEHLRIYCLTNPVVYLARDMDRIQRLLGLEDQAVRLLREGDLLHRSCSNFEFYNVEDRSSLAALHSDEGTPDRRSADYSFKLKDAKEDFTRFVQLVTGVEKDHSSYDSPFALLETPPELRSYTHAIFVRSSDIAECSVDLAELGSGGDAIELCIDRWGPGMATTISKQVALLRRHARTPIILSVDTTSSGIGTPVPHTPEPRSPVARSPTMTTTTTTTTTTATTTPSSSPPPPLLQDRNVYAEIMEHGLRLAVEYLAVDLGQDQSLLKRIIHSRGNTKIIGQYVFEPSTRVSWEDEGCVSLYLEAETLGCQLIRILRVATEREDNNAVLKFTNRIRALRGSGHPPLIAYNVGPLGRTSQVFNNVLTSVTHPAIRSRQPHARDPLITAQDAVQALFQSYVLDPLRFYIVGGSVAYSLSPAMHNAAFRHCGMNHLYSIPESTSLAALDRLGRDPQFGGASIVQPFRVQAFPKLASKSRHAEAIGAINTIMPLRARADGTLFPLQEQASRRNQSGRVLAWYGENTDWVGIMTCITRNLSPRNAISPLKSTGLVIGAGGMARAAIYAMLRLGCRQIFIHNRTVSRAEAVARHFNSWASSQVGAPEVVRVLRSAADDWPADANPPCLIASCVPADPSGTEPPANFEMPTQWLGSLTGGVVLELAYKPLDTPLLVQMRRFRSETGRPWVLVDGLENVTEQGIAQFELMTGRKAPRRLMTREVLRNYRGEDGRFDERDIQARLDGL
ncbi:hypothetical protein ASPZODRAFT_136149 [Penicilliopsis zonata CBS 506.65]|uniref:Uncharacterized protein n=1 Tax=Penicilliopsis zonata CBS 506.65 TaxID=1073090 RepID=A0A1L9S952_9EURO|nr:hypothetical protein ASPZODRAFT_136149 [Penicilliopsis zonata CBS 506.65]OJJ43685.1 hypothetical protein ASPZODRAFT_136149 [Penicilliopsis zonata CBS 506.65]